MTAYCVTRTEICIRGLELYCHIGAYADERRDRQRLLIDITCIPTDPTVKGDHLENAVDYLPIVHHIRTLHDTEPCHLLETLADKIAAICFGNSMLATVEMYIRKPNKLQDVEEVGIRRTYTKKEKCT